MPADLNRVTLVGRLTRDPELRHLPSGDPICSMRIAVNSRARDESGQWGDRPNFFDVTLFGRRGETVVNFMSKGSRIGVDGRLSWREWQAQDGSKRQNVEVVANDVFFLDSRGEGGGGGEGWPSEGSGRAGGAAPAWGSGGDDLPVDRSDMRPQSPAVDDDIPFSGPAGPDTPSESAHPMHAILLSEVEGLGEAGTVVNVARGYMRNYLQPRGLAEEATPARIAEVRRREERRRAAAVRAQEEARELADLLGRTILTLKAKAGEDGRLFGSITAADVAEAIQEARGVRIDRRGITVEPPIRALGTYSVPVELGPGLVTEVKTIVSPLLD